MVVTHGLPPHLEILNLRFQHMKPFVNGGVLEMLSQIGIQHMHRIHKQMAILEMRE